VATAISAHTCLNCLRAWSPERSRVLVESNGELQVLTAGTTTARLMLDLSEATSGGLPSSWQLQSAWSADGAWLAYVWNGGQTFIADADGQNPVELATTETPRTMPLLTPWDSSVVIAWASTGDHVALRLPSGGVYIAAPGSSDVVALQDIWDAATWSPDGALLALTGPHGAELVDATGSNLLVLDDGASARAIGWSSDSSRFAYLLAAGPNPSQALQVAAADGSATISAGPAYEAAWAPSSPLLALGRALDKDAGLPPRFSVWSLDAAADVVTESISNDQRLDAMAWSSSGERLLYGVVGGSPERTWVVIDPTDGSELQRFTANEFAAWNPVGTELASLTIVSGSGTATWKLELQPEAASATLLGDGIADADGWTWLPAPGGVAFANADGIFTTTLRGAPTRLASSNSSGLRFLRTTPGVSACPRASADCSGY
jgi:hypothetical protein